MINFNWKTEYSLTLMPIFIVALFLIPTSFTSKTAEYISFWNDAYNKIDYMFTAMSAQADSDIVVGMKNSKSAEQREEFMIKLAKPYLRLEELDKKYTPHYMNGSTVGKEDFYMFNSLYVSDNKKVVGIKNLNNTDSRKPAFMVMVDVNGTKRPNMWGKDIYGADIYADGSVRALGNDKNISVLKEDCSPKGTGVFCSYYYRIGGGFND